MPAEKKTKVDVYSKDNPIVVESNRCSHEEFISCMKKAMSQEDAGYHTLASRVGVDLPQVYRIFNPETNITVMSMNRFASALGKRVKISLVDIEGEDE